MGKQTKTPLLLHLCADPPHDLYVESQEQQQLPKTMFNHYSLMLACIYGTIIIRKQNTAENGQLKKPVLKNIIIFFIHFVYT